MRPSRSSSNSAEILSTSLSTSWTIIMSSLSCLSLCNAVLGSGLSSSSFSCSCLISMKICSISLYLVSNVSKILAKSLSSSPFSCAFNGGSLSSIKLSKSDALVLTYTKPGESEVTVLRTFLTPPVVAGTYGFSKLVSDLRFLVRTLASLSSPLALTSNLS